MDNTPQQDPVPSDPQEDRVAKPETLAGKEAYEMRKREKVRAKERSGSSKNGTQPTKKLMRTAIILLVVAALGYGLWVSIQRSAPQAEDQSVAYADMGNAHIEVGSAHEQYNSNPPTSGPHYAVPAKPGFRTEVIADEHLVHSLEHGLVWVSYHPRVADKVRAELEKMDDGWTVITERAANEHDIAIAAWGRLDRFNLSGDDIIPAEVQRIEDFQKRYRNRGPEKIPAGQHGGV